MKSDIHLADPSPPPPKKKKSFFLFREGFKKKMQKSVVICQTSLKLFNDIEKFEYFQTFNDIEKFEYFCPFFAFHAVPNLP